MNCRRTNRSTGTAGRAVSEINVVRRGPVNGGVMLQGGDALRRLVATACVLLALIATFVLYAYNPYVNGVAYVFQRECERSVLQSFANKLMHSYTELQNDREAPSFSELLNEVPKSQTIDYAGRKFTFHWRFVDSSDYQIGDTDVTIVLSRSADLKHLPSESTPLLVHVTSANVLPDGNCLLLVSPDGEVKTMYVADADLKALLILDFPHAVIDWVTKRK